MTAAKLFALALSIGPFVGCGWAWVQWQREEARRLAAASDHLLDRAAAALGAEPDVDREEPTPGLWVRPPWPTQPSPMRDPELRREPPGSVLGHDGPCALGRIPLTVPKTGRVWH